MDALPETTIPDTPPPAPLPSSVPEPPPVRRGGALRRFGFRFGFAYLVLYIAPAPVNSLPWTDWLQSIFDSAWHGLANLVAVHLLHLAPLTFQVTGSGDTLADYVIVLCTAVLALLAAAAWSVFDRAAEHPRLSEGLRLLLRYALAATMLGYGFDKLFAMQFPAPGLHRLTEPIGDASPMGLLWTFMGASTAYQMFGGALEVIGAVLLFWRRTTTLGALLLIGVMGNVVMLNFCYDVPVKLYASHLLLIAVVLAAPDARRLFHVLVLNRPVAARVEPGLPLRRWVHHTVKLVLVAVLIGCPGYQELQARQKWGPHAQARTTLAGLYQVKTFVRDGAASGTVSSEKGPWRSFSIDRNGVSVVEDGNGRRTVMGMMRDSGTALELVNPSDHSHHTFDYTRPDADHLQLTGTWEGAKLSVGLERVPQTFRLTSRGFHWVNPVPFNR